jgi:hypothetical protein
VAVPRGKSSTVAGGETKELVADGECDVVLSSSGWKAIEPLRWRSDVPLIATECVEDEDEDAASYSFMNNARGKSGSRGKARRCSMEATMAAVVAAVAVAAVLFLPLEQNASTARSNMVSG